LVTPKLTTTEKAEIPVERPSRRKKSARALKEEIPTLRSAAELAPPKWEVIQPEPNRPRGHVERIRPEGPRRRDPSEPRTLFASADLRVLRDGQVYQAVSNRDWTGDEKDVSVQ
jgi:hypothetical protein